MRKGVREEQRRRRRRWRATMRRVLPLRQSTTRGRQRQPP
jgi:hypothetical protein